MIYQPTVEELVEELRSIEEWRRMKAEEYPGDVRNEDAANHIDFICNDIMNLGECAEYKNLLEHYKSISGNDDLFSRQCEAENEFRKGIFFRNMPASGNEYLKQLRSCMS